jgi:hypothetical protein
VWSYEKFYHYERGNAILPGQKRIAANKLRSLDEGTFAMMKVLSFKLSNDRGTVYVEVPPDKDDLLGKTGADVVKDAGQSFSQALTAAQEVLDGFVKTLKPSELELSFGLKFSAKAGVVIASTDAEATLSLTAKWVERVEKKE